MDSALAESTFLITVLRQCGGDRLPKLPAFFHNLSKAARPLTSFLALSYPGTQIIVYTILMVVFQKAELLYSPIRNPNLSFRIIFVNITASKIESNAIAMLKIIGSISLGASQKNPT